MKTEELVESGLAELDFARMLFVNDQDFRFVVPKGKRGEDYDFEITLDKWVVCADVKCKLEQTDISENTIRNVLSDARTQLPEDKPGVVFIKVPQRWMTKYLHEQLMVEAARSFFKRGTRRIVSVKYYLAPYGVGGGHLRQGHVFKEIPNPRNRFDSNRSWELFAYRPPANTVNALPIKWRRLYDFPNTFLKVPGT